MFIPNTYNFFWNTDAQKLLGRMKREYEKFWNKDRSTLSLVDNLTPTEVSILASIVQKESMHNDEMPVIAGVYINRLRKGIPLQADPTILYMIGDTSIRRVRSALTEIVSPFNTYLNTGLPPAPICVPSIQAIDAVLNYAKHNYYYFCAREDFSGYHNFACGMNAHQKNAIKYQRALNRAGIH